MAILKRIFISPDHNYFGHHGKPPGEHHTLERYKIECVEGKGLVGDRFFGFKDDYKGQATFFEEEMWHQLGDQLLGEIPTQDRPSIAAFRRNLITKGINLNLLIGKVFAIGDVWFEGDSECTPCYWMDQAFAPGAHKALHGKGGLRARILNSGTIHVGQSIESRVPVK